MATRPTSEELEVLEVIRATEDGELSSKKVVEHFRGQKTSTRVINILDALWQKHWLVKRYPDVYMLYEKTSASTDVRGVDHANATAAE